MSNKIENKPSGSSSIYDRFLRMIERTGNLLPHPIMLFVWLCVLVVLLSAVGQWLDWHSIDPRPEGTSGKSSDGLVRAKSLLSEGGLRWMATALVENFVRFAPLGTVLVALLGVGISEHSGLISAAIRLMILKAPSQLVTVVLVFAGVISNTASEIGYVVIVPMGAAIYFSLNRHPLAGLAAAFAGVSGGYSANLLLGTIDPLLAGITTKAAEGFAPEYYLENPVNPACNLYFLIASTFLVTGVGSWVSLYLVEPRLGKYSASMGEGLQESAGMQPLTKQEIRGLKITGLVVVGMALGLVYLCLTPGQVKGLVGESISLPYLGALGQPLPGDKNPAFLKAVVALVFVGFLIPGIVYGAVTGTIRSDKDVIQSMSKSMSSMGMYIVLVFFAAQFVEFFNWSNLGLLVAINGADFIRWMKLDNPLIFVVFIGLSAILNLLMGSASAKWGFMAPIFVPMLMGIGYSPEVTQLAYRIGDSCTNVISPMMSYFGMIYVFAAKYDRNFKLGTLISIMMPYSLVFLLCWTVFFYLWVFGFGFPIGPDASIYYQPTSA
jgi:aminobenzoyl-glutamate transport protein